MTLACPDTHSFSLLPSLLWSIALLLPVIAFLVLPKLLPLGRELWWTRVKAILPLAWLAERFGQDPSQARATRERVRSAWLGELSARHPDGGTATVVRDEGLLGGALRVGRIVQVAMLVAGLTTIALVLRTDGSQRLALSAGVLMATLVTSWIGRIAGNAAAVSARAAAVSGNWGPLARFAGGAGIGLGYGLVAGFSAAFFGLAASIPTTSLIAWEAAPSHVAMWMLTIGGVMGAFVGGTAGFLFVGIATLAARRRA